MAKSKSKATSKSTFGLVSKKGQKTVKKVKVDKKAKKKAKGCEFC